MKLMKFSYIRVNNTRVQRCETKMCSFYRHQGSRVSQHKDGHKECAHSPMEPVVLSVQTLVAKVESRKSVAVKNRERLPTLPETRFFARSPNITVRREDTRPASRLRDRAFPTPTSCFSFPSSPFWACIPLPRFLSRHAQKPPTFFHPFQLFPPCLSLSLSSNSTRLSIIDKRGLITESVAYPFRLFVKRWIHLLFFFPFFSRVVRTSRSIHFVRTIEEITLNLNRVASTLPPHLSLWKRFSHATTISQWEETEREKYLSVREQEKKKKRTKRRSFELISISIAGSTEGIALGKCKEYSWTYNWRHARLRLPL